MASLGFSEYLWQESKAIPHWVYFLDGRMVYASEGFDCTQDKTCEYRQVKLTSPASNKN